MSRPPKLSRATLIPLMMQGPISAFDMAAKLKVNRTTIVRGLATLGDEVVSMGETRRLRYALRRSIRNSGNRWPIYVIDEAGRAHHWAELESLYERRWRILWMDEPPEWAHQFSSPEGLWEGFPFFLGGVRPQGFLGRAIALQISSLLALPDDPRTWSDDHILVYLHGMSEDLPGSLVVGDDCLRRALAKTVPSGSTPKLLKAERLANYPRLAQLASHTLPGSSAGGEQTKFLTSVQDSENTISHVLVKFSAPMDQPTGQRWADLLLCEFHAHEILAEFGFGMRGASILDAEGRRFLEVPRFDRTAVGGRRGVISLEALFSSAIGLDGSNWPQAGEQLQLEGFIDQETLTAIRKLHAFGELIGNSDMHAGNLSFWLTNSLPFRLSPAYDMLPMLWAPGPQGEIVPRHYAPSPPLPSALEAWSEAASWALLFWKRVTDDKRFSPDFHAIATLVSAQLDQLINHVRR